MPAVALTPNGHAKAPQPHVGPTISCLRTFCLCNVPLLSRFACRPQAATISSIFPFVCKSTPTLRQRFSLLHRFPFWYSALSLYILYIYFSLSLPLSTVLPRYPTDRRHPPPLGHFGTGPRFISAARVRHHGGFIITSTGGRMVSLVLSPLWQLTEKKC